MNRVSKTSRLLKSFPSFNNKNATFVALESNRSNIYREFATKFGRKPVKKIVIKKEAPAPQKTYEESWVSVKDEASGQIYWWNQMTNETTSLGEPKPVGPRAVQSYSGASPPAVGSQGGGMLSGFGGMVAQGMAFGAGSSMAHHAIGSMFGGGSSHSSGGGQDSAGPMSSGGDSDSGGDDWEV